MLQDMWNAGILILCQHAKRVGNPGGERCNATWFDVRFVDPTYRPMRGPLVPSGIHPVYTFCDSYFYPPEYYLNIDLPRWYTSESVSDFLDKANGKVTLVTHTHHKYCRTNKAGAHGTLDILKRRMERFLGKGFAWITSVPTNPVNWAFHHPKQYSSVLSGGKQQRLMLRETKDSLSSSVPMQLREFREFSVVHVVVMSPPGHSQSRARWRSTFSAQKYGEENPYRYATESASLDFVVPYYPGIFPQSVSDSKIPDGHSRNAQKISIAELDMNVRYHGVPRDHQGGGAVQSQKLLTNGFFTAARLEAEDDAFEDVILLPIQTEQSDPFVVSKRFDQRDGDKLEEFTDAEQSFMFSGNMPRNILVQERQKHRMSKGDVIAYFRKSPLLLQMLQAVVQKREARYYCLVLNDDRIQLSDEAMWNLLHLHLYSVEGAPHLFEGVFRESFVASYSALDGDVFFLSRNIIHEIIMFSLSPADIDFKGSWFEKPTSYGMLQERPMKLVVHSRPLQKEAKFMCPHNMTELVDSAKEALEGTEIQLLNVTLVGGYVEGNPKPGLSLLLPNNERGTTKIEPFDLVYYHRDGMDTTTLFGGHIQCLLKHFPDNGTFVPLTSREKIVLWQSVLFVRVEAPQRKSMKYEHYRRTNPMTVGGMHDWMTELFKRRVIDLFAPGI